MSFSADTIASLLGPGEAPWPSIALVKWIVVIAACCVATRIDVRSRRIPNALTFPLLLAGVLSWFAFGGTSGFLEALGGMAIAGLPFVLLWLIGGGGAGDAKMMLAIGAWLGTDHGFIAAVSVGIAGGILSISYAKAHRSLLLALANTAWMVVSLPIVLLGPGRLQDRQKLVPVFAGVRLKAPYSVAMLGGTCAAAGWIWICAT